MGAHIIDGKFQSDKYPWCKPGFVPLKVADPMAQPELWAYAQKRRAVDPEFASDLEQALRDAGYVPQCPGCVDDATHGSRPHTCQIP